MGMLSWTKGVSGNFNNPADWTIDSGTDTVPTGSDQAEIGATGTYTVTSSETNTVFGLGLTSHATLAVTNGTFTAVDGTNGADNAGTISIGNNTVFIVGDPSLTDNSSIELQDSGIISLNSTGSPTTLVLSNFDGSSQIVDLDGGGKLTLSSNSDNLITTSDSGTILENNDTISGSGTINHLILENDASGVINANGAKPLVIYPGISPNSNSGTIEATSTGGLELDDVVFNNSGTIKAATAGAVIDLEEANIDNGTVSTVAGSSITTSLPSLDTIAAVSVDNAGHIEIGQLSTLVFGSSNTVENSGVIGLNAASGLSSILELDSTVSLEGKGRVTLTDSPENLIDSNGSPAQLNNINNTISGAGTIGDTDMSLDNDSLIDGTGKNSLIIAASASGLQNSGTIESTSTGGVEFSEVQVDNGSNGMVAAAATGAHIDLSGSSEILGGIVKTVAGSTIDSVSGQNNEEIADSVAFDNAGTMLVNDNCEFLLGSNVDNSGVIDVNGDIDPTYLEIVGTVSLSGAGKVTVTGTGAILSNGSPAEVVNVNNTISGAGTIGDSSLDFDNQSKGLVDATGYLDIHAASVDNEGTMENSRTGDLTFDNGVVTNSGTIENTEAGVVTMVDPIDNNGKLSVSAGYFDIVGTLT
jgi:hypothetical protein